MMERMVLVDWNVSSPGHGIITKERNDIKDLIFIDDIDVGVKCKLQDDRSNEVSEVDRFAMERRWIRGPWITRMRVSMSWCRVGMLYLFKDVDTALALMICCQEDCHVCGGGGSNFLFILIQYFFVIVDINTCGILRNLVFLQRIGRVAASGRGHDVDDGMRGLVRGLMRSCGRTVGVGKSLENCEEQSW
jgi:hypothetical protein